MAQTTKTGTTRAEAPAAPNGAPIFWGPFTEMRPRFPEGANLALDECPFATLD